MKRGKITQYSTDTCSGVFRGKSISAAKNKIRLRTNYTFLAFSFSIDHFFEGSCLIAGVWFCFQVQVKCTFWAEFLNS